MRLAKAGVAMLFAVGLLLGAGASAQVVQGTFDINDPGIGNDAVFPFDVSLSATGVVNLVTVILVCGGPGPADWVTLTIVTTPPDSVRLSSTKAKIQQKQKGNLPDFVAEGSGGLTFGPTPVKCEKNKAQGEVNTKKLEGKAKVQAKNCTGLAAAELDYIDTLCGTDNKALQIKRDGTSMKTVKVNLKGPY